MHWKIDFGNRDWYRWFAWRPVRLSHDENDTRVWLEWIERRIQNCQGYLCSDYRSIR
jgi:hypothetical protein